MRVWVVGRGYPTKENNMLGSFELEQAQMLAKNGMEVFYPLIDLRSFRHRRKYGIVLEKKGGVTLATLNVPIGRLLSAEKRALLSKVLFKWQFRQLSKKCGVPDVIHVHYPSIWKYKRFEEMQKKGAKIVGTEHWSQVQDGSLPEKNRRFLAEHVEKSDAFICVSELLKKGVLKLTDTKRNIEVVPNVVADIFGFEEKNEKEGSDFKFAAVGRLVEIKRFDLLIEAFADEFANDENVFLDIIGGGEESLSLEQIIRNRKVEKRVRLIGVMERAELAHSYPKYDALVVSSRSETFCVPVIEAMSCGLPVITTNAIGALEYIHDWNGIVVEAENRQKLSLAMREMYENYSKFDRRRIAGYIKSCIGEDAVCKHIREIYMKVLGKQA